MNFRILKTWLVISILTALSIALGCTMPKTVSTDFYILDPIDSNILPVLQKDQDTPLSIGITSFRLPQYLERPQIVTRSSDNKLELAESHQWGGNLRKNMARVLAKNLSQLISSPNVFIYPDRPQSSPDFLIELAVMKFERDPDNKIRLSAQWRLIRDKDKKTITTQITELESMTIQNRSDMTETVRTMSELMGKLSSIIGNEILTYAH